MKKTIFLILSILVLFILGWQVFGAYIANHTYYRGTSTAAGMLGSGANWKILVWSLIAAALPVSYVLFSKKKTLKWFSITLFSGLFVYSVAQAVVKEAILGPGFLLMLFKYVILALLIAYFVVGVLAIGTWIRKKIFGSHDWNIEQIFLNLGLGLIAFCLVNYALLLLHLFYGIIILIVFLTLGFAAWKMKHDLKKAKEELEGLLDHISWEKMSRSPWMFVYVLLMLFSIMYIYHGFVLADIPYPTAWDANHAYMYYPRIWALNSGYYWEQTLAAAPQIWFGYLTFWFKFMYIFGQNTWISADNLAVIMNFISGVLVLVFGLILVKEIVSFIHKGEDKAEPVLFVAGWALLILWLTSGMGAFLVFVDNKTDLGVMALTILALYSGFFFLNQLKTQEEGKKQSIHYVILSGIFFAGAMLAKQTATFDVINFSLLLLTLWFGGILAIGVFLAVLGVLGKSGILTVQKFLSGSSITQLLGAGGVVTFGGILYAWLRKKLQYVRYFVLWAVVIAATLIIVKGPYLLAKGIKIEHKISPVQFIKDIFLTSNIEKTSSKSRVLVASNVDYNILLAADVQVDDNSDTATNTMSSTQDNAAVASCKAKNISEEDLYKNLQTPPGSALNEDVGRYIGYGWKTFNNPWWGFMVGNGCHAWSSDANILCENAKTVENPTSTGLQELLTKLPDGSKGKTLVEEALSSDSLGFVNKMKDLEAYYQDKSWNKADGVVSLPYTMLVPFNITFNWSLQNLTSYYTDIGVMWLLCLFIICLGFIYSMVKWNKNLFAVTLASLCGWALWWVAGGAILWYSLGVVIWTIIATVCVLHALSHNNNKTQKRLFAILLAIFAVIAVYQLLLNFIRISSQGAGGAFTWYRANVGNINSFDQNLQQQVKQKIGYNDKDVFSLQFGHYDKTLALLEKRNPEDGFIVAGTYLPYFVRNQHGLKIDGFLVDFWKNLSDNDPCNTYLRLRHENSAYIVIDPNIASVVMGDANSSLMDRVFGKMDNSGKKLAAYGSMTMIANMVQKGYMSLANTNIISAKYAFELSIDELRRAYPSLNDVDEMVLRAKLSTLRFWPEAQTLFAGLPSIFTSRMLNGKGLEDIADMLGKDVDTAKLLTIANNIITQNKLDVEAINKLNADEKLVLVQYISVYNMMKSNNQQYQAYINNLTQQSILGNSQLITFILN